MLLTLEDDRRAGEPRSSAGLSPDGIAKYEEGETGGGERGSEGGGRDLNLGKLEPVCSEGPRVIATIDSGPVRRSELENEKAGGGCKFAEVSKLPEEEVIEEEEEEEDRQLVEVV